MPLSVLSPDGKTHRDLAAAHPTLDPSEFNKELANYPLDIPHANSPVSWIMDEIEKNQGPVLVDFNDLIQRFPDYPQFKVLLSESVPYTLRDCLTYNLKLRGEIIGMFCINSLQKNFFKKNIFSQFQAITDSVSIAVGNVLINQQMERRQNENELLLEISKVISSKDNIVDLLAAVEKLVRPIFRYSEAGVLVLDEKEENFIDYYVVNHKRIPATEESKHRSAQAMEKGYSSIPASGSLIEYYMNQPPTYGTVHEAAALGIEAPYLEILLNDDLNYFICAPLRVSGKSFGLFNIFFTESTKPVCTNLGFFTQITDLMAVAISNVLATDRSNRYIGEIEELNKQLTAQNQYLVEEVQQQYKFNEMIGENETFREICNSIGLVAKTDSTVLILGETGTGKELVARAIHNSSQRSDKALIKLNCAALPSNLIESELFGHERGAFTGATDKRIGKFELANGSTLFLDEVGELPIDLQSKLLRALQEKEIERLGSNKVIRVDVRIIAATNRDLSLEIKQGKFRQDLYYRLHIFPITLPPLRERKEDIPLLAMHFLDRYVRKTGKSIKGFSKSAIDEMIHYDWPGNIRELEHVIERSLIMCKNSLIHNLILPREVRDESTPMESKNMFNIKPWFEHEREYLLEVLKLTRGNVKGKNGAAELLKLPPSTLQARLKKLGIERKHIWSEPN